MTGVSVGTSWTLVRSLTRTTPEGAGVEAKPIRLVLFCATADCGIATSSVQNPSRRYHTGTRMRMPKQFVQISSPLEPSEALYVAHARGE